ncbi:MAG: 16S rRNA processing protein RimM [Ruminococcaceae bacterium]|nr:16S rRNA processing protein RimM [Oscillospiraceae bacterium]
MKKKYLECGRIINKRGIGGELKVECYCDSPAAVKNVKVLYADSDGKTAYIVKSIKEYKGFIYVKLDKVDSAEKADEMRGQLLFADRDDIIVGDDKFFIADLIGLDVVDAESKKVYGKITDVINYGASDIYVVSDGHKEYMLPAIDSIVLEKKLESYVLIKPIPGIFDDAEEIR